jgi:MerR family transcriptional regulator, light-induced transcriptional regulator
MTSSRAERRLRPPSGAPPPASTRVGDADIQLEPLAEEVCRRYRAEHPDEGARYGDAGNAWCVHDTLYLLTWAADDLRPAGGHLIGNVTWLARVLEARRFPVERLARNVQIAADVVAGAGFSGSDAMAARLREAVANVVAGGPPERPPAGSPVRNAYLAALLRADPQGARLVVETALAAGMPLRALYLEVFQPALHEVGRLWQNGEATVAQEHLATATTQTLAARLSAQLVTAPRLGLTAVVSGTQDELHALGARFVGDFLEGEGWTVIDLGPATPTDDLVRIVAECRPRLVCLSTALTTNLVHAEDVIAALRQLDDPPVIAVGGYAYHVDPGLAVRLGADVHASDPAVFLERLRELDVAAPGP